MFNAEVVDDNGCAALSTPRYEVNSADESPLY